MEKIVEIQTLVTIAVPALTAIPKVLQATKVIPILTSATTVFQAPIAIPTVL